MTFPPASRRAFRRIAARSAVGGTVVAVSAMLMGGLAAAHPTPSVLSARGTVVPFAPAVPPAATADPAAAVAPTTTTLPVAPPTPPTTAPPQPQDVVVFGDSVPAGTACGCAGFGAGVASALSGGFTNFSAPGLTTDGLLSQLNSASVATALRSASVVLVTIGANDFDETAADDPNCSDLSCYAATMKTVTANMNAIVSQIKGLAPSGARIVVTGYWNVFLDGRVGASNGPTYVDTSDALSRALNSELAQVSNAHGVLYSDIYTPFKGAGNVDDTALLAPDGDHPNAAGHEVIADAILATLNAQG